MSPLTIRVSLATPQGKIEQQSDTFTEHLAVTRGFGVNWREWNVTHRPTGYSCARARTKRQATRAMQRLQAAKVPWAKLTAKTSRRYGKTIREALGKRLVAELGIAS